MLREIIDTIEFLDDASNGATAFREKLPDGDYGVEITPFESDLGTTEFIKVLFPGSAGKSAGGTAPTMGVIGSSGGLRLPGRYPGLASDADGCIVGLAVALRLARMRTRGQQLAGDVLVSTHICQQARPVPVRAKSAERALAGSWLTDSAVRAAAEMVIAGALPLSDNGYKCNLIVNLTERALRKNRDQRA